jgi:NAD(P)-dependent dehydrogenase (short-subunit alcohol dehydrogenase family)
MLAEIYATSSLESLTVLNESLGGKVADGSKPEEVKKVAVDTMKIIQARNAGDGNEGVRDGFAALMFIRSSNGKPADLRETLISGLPANSRELARDEWFPAALGEGREKSYEPMLAVGDGARQPELGEGWVAPTLVADASIYGMLSPIQDIYAYKKELTGVPFIKPVAYSAAKSGIYNLTRYLATYWGRQGIRVNTLTPAGVWRDTQDEIFQKNFCERMPMGRMSREDEYNGSLIFLASKASSFMTGSNLVVDGGWTAW